MGKAEYIGGVRDALRGSEQIDPPDLYKEVWKLAGVNAVLTSNLDGFVSKAHRRIRRQEDPVIFNGRDAPAYTHLLGARRPFIANLHGVIDDQTSWVFTRSDVNQLFANPAYHDFLAAVFSSMTVVFAGISADDAAAGGTLRKLTERGMDLGEHYWVTDRLGVQTWAATSGLQLIRYTPGSAGTEIERHTAPLRDMLTDMRTFASHDAPAAIVIPKVDVVSNLPTSRDLRVEDEDKLRSLLSGHAKYILLGNSSDTASPAYTDFLNDYSSNIHQAWHLTIRPPDNLFYGYKVLKQIYSSSFSTVWELQGATGEALALKILRIENLRAGPQIESFRRGVQSLEYLTDARVPGTARLVAAFEIPTAVVMEYVEGASLSETIKADLLEPWPDRLLVMVNVCKHLMFSHNLPQGVLHRDVRPSNIMLPFVYWTQEAVEAAGHTRHEVTLLNYDLSWHTLAVGETIIGSSEESGYYAPEQATRDSAPSRSTLVDSYGVGMTLFNVFGEVPPPAAGSKSTDWKDLVKRRIRVEPRLMWRSAPTRLRRLILDATHPVPANRPSVTQIEAELRLLVNAVTGKINDLPIDFWAEELMSRCEEADYECPPGTSEFRREPRVGRSISLRGSLSTKTIVLSFRNQALDSTNRTGIDRMWTDKLNRAKEMLRASGWEQIDKSRYGGMELLLAAEIPIRLVRDQFERVLEGLKRALGQVRIE